MCDATHDTHAHAVIDSVSCVASDITELFHASTTQGQGESIPIVHNDESKNESDVLRMIPRDEILSSTLQDAESLGNSSTPNDCPVTTVSGVESRSEDLDQTAPFTHSLRNYTASSKFNGHEVFARIAATEERVQAHWFATFTDCDGWIVP